MGFCKASQLLLRARSISESSHGVLRKRSVQGEGEAIIGPFVKAYKKSGHEIFGDGES